MERGGALVRVVLDELWSAGQPRGSAPNTVQSALERLVRRGLAERCKVGRAFE